MKNALLISGLLASFLGNISWVKAEEQGYPPTGNIVTDQGIIKVSKEKVSQDKPESKVKTGTEEGFAAPEGCAGGEWCPPSS